MIKVIIPAFLSVFLLYSCVSVGKYDEMTANRDSLQASCNAMEKTIYKNNIELDNLKGENKDKAQKISALEQDLKANYERMKSTSSDKTSEMLTTIENLQKQLNEETRKAQEIKNKLDAREQKINDLRSKLTDALLGFADKGLSVSVKNGKVYVSLSNKLLFKSGRTDIDENGKQALLELAKVLKGQPDINVMVEGHTDTVAIGSSPRFKDNWDLSVLRATEVVRYLTEDGGVNPKRVIASGRSKYFPVSTGTTPEDLAANRRTEIILTPRLEEIFQIIGD